MPSPLIHVACPEKLVAMGSIVVGRAPDRLKAFLGSCVGVVLYHPGQQVAAVAHVVLPESTGHAGPPGKFADTAIPQMLLTLSAAGVPPRGLRAMIAGGSQMFGPSITLDVGLKNVAAARRTLDLAGCRLSQQDVGGVCGRRMLFDCESGLMTVTSTRRSDLCR